MPKPVRITKNEDSPNVEVTPRKGYGLVIAFESDVGERPTELWRVIAQMGKGKNLRMCVAYRSSKEAASVAASEIKAAGGKIIGFGCYRLTQT